MHKEPLLLHLPGMKAERTTARENKTAHFKFMMLKNITYLKVSLDLLYRGWTMGFWQGGFVERKQNRRNSYSLYQTRNKCSLHMKLIKAKESFNMQIQVYFDIYPPSITSITSLIHFNTKKWTWSIEISGYRCKRMYFEDCPPYQWVHLDYTHLYMYFCKFVPMFSLSLYRYM